MPNQFEQRMAEVLFQFHSSLAEEFTKVLAQHYSGFEARLAEELRLLQESQSAAAAKERAQVAETLRQQVRRIARSENMAEWTSAVLDAAAGSASICALFGVAGGCIRCQDTRNPAHPPPAALVVSLQAAPAIANAVTSEDAVVTVAAPGELSTEVAALFRCGDGERTHLFPVFARRTCVGVLCAQVPAGSEAWVEAVSVVAGLAYPALAPAAAPSELVKIGTVPEVPVSAALAVSWQGLPEAERERHRNAQRFSRVQVAEMRLYKAAAVRSGRAVGDLYQALKQEIDTSREAFRCQFLAESPTMVDYFHQELVRTLAGGQVSLLGPAYPGPLAP